MQKRSKYSTNFVQNYTSYENLFKISTHENVSIDIFWPRNLCHQCYHTKSNIYCISYKSHFSYQSIITRGFTRIDRILKVTMTPHENSELFIEEYLKLVEEREQSEFQKILEMKVLKLRNITMDNYGKNTHCRDLILYRYLFVDIP